MNTTDQRGHSSNLFAVGFRSKCDIFWPQMERILISVSIELMLKTNHFPVKQLRLKLLLVTDGELVYGGHFLALAESSKLLISSTSCSSGLLKKPNLAPDLAGL